jgi:hypothetical protein
MIRGGGLRWREEKESGNRLGPGKLLIVVALVLVLGIWGFANTKDNRGFLDDVYQAARLFPLHSGRDAQPVPWQLQVARFLAIAADAAVLAAFGSILFFGRDVPNRLRLKWSSGHVVVCGAGVHGARMVEELSRRNKVVVVDLDDRAPGMKKPTRSREMHVVDDAVSESTLRHAGLRKAARLIAVTGDDFVNSQIVSTVRALARKGDVGDDLEVFVQIEDPWLARSLEVGEQSDQPHVTRAHVFTPNALAAATLFGEGPDQSVSDDQAGLLASAEDQQRPHLLLAGDHPLLEAVVLAQLRRGRARLLRSGTERAPASASNERPPVRVSLVGPGAVSRVERLIQAWSPEPEVMELEANDMDIRGRSSLASERWLRERRTPGHALVVSEDELDSIELTVAISRVLAPGVPLTRVTTQPESELDRQLHARTRHTVQSIADLAWGSGGSGVDWIAARNRILAALRREEVSNPAMRADELVEDWELGVHSDAAFRISVGSRPLGEALLKAVGSQDETGASISISALVDAGVSIDLESAGNLRRAAQQLSRPENDQRHDAFRAWCEYARHASDEALIGDGTPTDPVGASVVNLRLTASGRITSSNRSPSRAVASCAPRVAIVAGGADSVSDATSAALDALLQRAFLHYDGLVLADGTGAAVPSAVRAAAEACGVAMVGYAPPGDGLPGERVTVRDVGFSAGTRGGVNLQEEKPLAMWSDVLDAGFTPSTVRVIAFPGGEMMRSEIVLARALGAAVVWLDPCNESDTALEDELPLGADGVLELPPDPMTLRAFLVSPPTVPEGWPTDRIARYLHNDYRETHRERKAPDDPALAPWERLLPALQRSNVAAAADIPNKLHVIGKRPTKGGQPVRISDDDVELLAELEHGRYNYERLSAGWRLGERQVLRLLNPYLVPWDDLVDDVKEWDRESVRNIEPAMAQVGWGVAET